MQGKHSLWILYTDFLEMIAISISNGAEIRVFGKANEDREKDYLKISKKYSKDEIKNFANITGLLIEAFDKNLSQGKGYRDLLGSLMMELGLGNKWNGQFFTPDDMANMMAKISFDKDKVKKAIDEEGYYTGFDEACGGGVTMLALANVMMKNGFNHQANLFVDCGDLDRIACFIAYIQLSFAGVAARIRNRDALSGECFEVWFTPFYWFHNFPSRFDGSYKRLMKFRKAIDEVIRLEEDFEEKKTQKKDKETKKKASEVIKKISGDQLSWF